MTEQIEQDVREMLRRHVGDATTDPDAWDRIASRVNSDDTTPASLEFAPCRAHFNRPLVLGSIAATLLLVLASLAVLRGGDDSQTIRTADDTSPSPSASPSPSPAPSPSASAAPAPKPAFEATAELAARDWVAVAGDAGNAAWDLLAEQSRESVGSRSRLYERRSELAEGWGAWAEATDVAYRTVTLVGDEPGMNPLPPEIPRLAVVIITGRVSPEGTTAFRTASLPVRGTKDRVEVDPFSDVAVELEPDPVFKGDRIPSRTELGAFTPSGARVWFVLDDRDVVGPEDSQGADGDQQHVTFRTVPPLSSGQHSYTVAVLTIDGRIASRSTTYTVG